MNQPKSRTPPAKLGDKWIAIRGDKWIRDRQRAGHHNLDRAGHHPPDWQEDKWVALRGDKWIGDIPRAAHHQAGWEGNELLYGETNEFETAKEPDTTSQTGREMNCYTGRQMNSRQPKSRTPPAKLRDKWIALRGDKWIGDIPRAAHHQADWERNESAKEPDTTSQTGRQMNCYKGWQMNSRPPESRTPQPGQSRTPI